ncbi:hypothetical protein V5O48_015262, partial [Marasmius crinis-equi]
DPIQLVLQISSKFIDSVTTRPVKYLGHISWCICGAHGKICSVEGVPVDTESTASEVFGSGKHFEFVPDEPVDFVRTIDRSFFRPRAGSSISSYKDPGLDFFENVRSRDGRSIFSIQDAKRCDACHILPRRLGDLTDHGIQTHDLSNISTIDDVANGILLPKDIHFDYERHKCGVLFAPSHYLEPDDLKFASRSDRPEEFRRRDKQLRKKNKLTQRRKPKDGVYVFHRFTGWPVMSLREEMERDTVAHGAKADFAKLTNLPNSNACHFRYGASLLYRMIDRELSKGWIELQKGRGRQREEGEEGSSEDEGDGAHGTDADYSARRENEEEEEEAEEEGIAGETENNNEKTREEEGEDQEEEEMAGENKSENTSDEEGEDEDAGEGEDKDEGMLTESHGSGSRDERPDYFLFLARHRSIMRRTEEQEERNLRIKSWMQAM